MSEYSLFFILIKAIRMVADGLADPMGFVLEGRNAAHRRGGGHRVVKTMSGSVTVAADSATVDLLKQFV